MLKPEALTGWPRSRRPEEHACFAETFRPRSDVDQGTGDVLAQLGQGDRQAQILAWNICLPRAGAALPVGAALAAGMAIKPGEIPSLPSPRQSAPTMTSDALTIA